MSRPSVSHLQKTVPEKGESSMAMSPAIIQVKKHSKPGKDWVAVFRTRIRAQRRNVCWAIAIAAAVEGCINIEGSRRLTKEKDYRVQASAQELMDWCLSEEDKANNEPLVRMLVAWEHIKGSGLSRTKHCPWIGIPATEAKRLKKGADYDRKKPRERDILKISGFEEFDNESATWQKTKKIQDKDILAALAHGPVVASLFAFPSFGLWTGEGIYGGPLEHELSTKSKTMLHCVVIVGYGSDRRLGYDENDDEGNVPYFLIRNSYGVQWGTQGYGRVIRDRKDKPSVFVYYAYPHPCHFEVTVEDSLMTPPSSDDDKEAASDKKQTTNAEEKKTNAKEEKKIKTNTGKEKKKAWMKKK